MAYRTFVDPEGVTWQVWEVRPARVERRREDRRRGYVPIAGVDRRSQVDRRQRQEQRLLLTPELANGWLAFHGETDRRRYTPIPDGWASMTPAELFDLSRLAKRVRGGTLTSWLDSQRGAQTGAGSAARRQSTGSRSRAKNGTSG